MTNEPSIEMQKTLELFDVKAPDAGDVQWFIEFLTGRGWTTAAQVLQARSMKATEDAKRWIRALAELCNGQVVGFSKGYKLTKAMTRSEYERWRNTFKKAARTMNERVQKTDEVFGWTEKE